MHKIIKIALISGLLPLISGCSGVFEDKPAKMFELTLNDGTAIKCSRSATESPAENFGKSLKDIVDSFIKVLKSPMGITLDDKTMIDNESMMVLAFAICNDVTDIPLDEAGEAGQ